MPVPVHAERAGCRHGTGGIKQSGAARDARERGEGEADQDGRRRRRGRTQVSGREGGRRPAPAGPHEPVQKKGRRGLRLRLQAIWAAAELDSRGPSADTWPASRTHVGPDSSRPSPN